MEGPSVSTAKLGEHSDSRENGVGLPNACSGVAERDFVVEHRVKKPVRQRGLFGAFRHAVSGKQVSKNARNIPVGTVTVHGNPCVSRVE